jgi:predicted nucleic acid-binding protein
LILVDSSVWIDFLSARPGPGGQELRRLIEEAAPVAVAGIVVTEVLQGLKRDVERIENYLSLFDLLEANGFQTYQRAAALFRLARSRGATLTTTDALIATIAAENRAEVFSLDRDFIDIAQIGGVALYKTGP